MFYLSDFEVKQTKEQEICERIQRAQIDRLIQSIRPRRAGVLRRLVGGIASAAGHFLSAVGGQLVALNSESQLARHSNPS